MKTLIKRTKKALKKRDGKFLLLRKKRPLMKREETKETKETEQ